MIRNWFDVWGRDVAENECVKISKLVARSVREGAADRVEDVFSGLGNSGSETEEESLDTDDVRRGDISILGGIGCSQPATGWDNDEAEEMSLCRKDVHCVNAAGAANAIRLRWGHGEGTAGW